MPSAMGTLKLLVVFLQKMKAFIQKNTVAMTSQNSLCLCVACSTSSSLEYKVCYITMHTVPTL